MQVERTSSEVSGGRVSNAWVTCPIHTDNIPKGMLLCYLVLAYLSVCYPCVQGRLPTRYSPVRRSLPKKIARLACVRHAASVHPEPGSNSQNKFFEFISPTIYLRYRFRYIRCSNKFDYLLRLSLSEYLAWLFVFNS